MPRNEYNVHNICCRPLNSNSNVSRVSSDVGWINSILWLLFSSNPCGNFNTVYEFFLVFQPTTQLFQVWLLDITNFSLISHLLFIRDKMKKKLLKSFCFLKKFYSRIYSSFLWAYTTYMKLFWQKVSKKVWRGWFFILFTMWLDFVYDKVHICFGPRYNFSPLKWAYFEIHDIFSRNFNKNENLSWKI